MISVLDSGMSFLRAWRTLRFMKSSPKSVCLSRWRKRLEAHIEREQRLQGIMSLGLAQLPASHLLIDGAGNLVLAEERCEKGDHPLLIVLENQGDPRRGQARSSSVLRSSVTILQRSMPRSPSLCRIASNLATQASRLTRSIAGVCARDSAGPTPPLRSA